MIFIIIHMWQFLIFTHTETELGKEMSIYPVTSPSCNTSWAASFTVSQMERKNRNSAVTAGILAAQRTESELFPVWPLLSHLCSLSSSFLFSPPSLWRCPLTFDYFSKHFSTLSLTVKFRPFLFFFFLFISACPETVNFVGMPLHSDISTHL